MGEVFQATHLGLGQRVAIKLLHAHVREDSDAVLRFLREAQLAARIQSQHVARVIDVGHLEDGEPYIVMEYLDGEDLAAIVARGPLPVQQAVDYVVQACDAMMEAHNLGIVHRDLKPSNLFLSQRADGARIVKVLDFGVSKLIAHEYDGAGLTRTTTRLGSPAYMSPEQAHSARDVDARSDVWAFGIILFEFLCGRTPFAASSSADVIPLIVNAAPPRPSEFCPEVAPRLEAAVLRCLQKKPEHRFQTLAELVLEIAHYGTPRSLQIAHRAAKGAHSLSGDREPLIPRTTSDAGSSAPNAPLAKRGRVLPVLLLLALLAAVLMAASNVLLLRRPR